MPIVNRVLTAIVFAALLHSPAGQTAEPTIVVVGDSLSSGYGVALDESWVSLLERRLAAEGYGHRVVNASIAGDTSAGGLSRLPRLLAVHQPEIVIISLGGNDGLRGQPVDVLRTNLARMIEISRAESAEILLIGIQIPPNYGPAYTGAFAGVYPELAAGYDLPLVDFLLDGVALEDGLMQSDRIHPNAAGHAIMFENVWAVLEEIL